MKQTLNVKVSQQLSLTPQLRQSLRLLKLSSLELEHEIQHALDNNPLLERNESEMAGDLEIPASDTSNVPQPESENTNQSIIIGRSDDVESEQTNDTEWQDAFEPLRSSESANSFLDDKSGDNFLQYLCEDETLYEHLSWQIRMTSLSAKDKQIADALIRCFDDDGYLDSDVSEICELLSSNTIIKEAEVNAVLSLIKTLEPAGIGARNLQERLLILLNQTPKQVDGLDIAELIITKHLDLLASHNFEKMRKLLGVTGSALVVSIDLITGLNPHIASQFKSDVRGQVVPDIFVKKVNEQWFARLNPDSQSKLHINQVYADFSSSGIDKNSIDYIKENLLQAKLFIKSLRSRYDTMLMVSQVIVEHQHAFFDHGHEHMKPMVLQQIAQQLKMHESTISRATSGKYLLCSRGVFELKYFFSSSLSTVDGVASSSTAIRSLIRKLVDGESKVKPLSDQKIVESLKSQGYILARRTVAKYRESLQIASSSKRKSIR